MNDRVRPKPKWQTEPRKPAWVPPPYSHSDALALKATWDGEATPEQQRQALQWIIIHAGQYGEISYRSDKDGGDRETAFAEGRRFVAQQMQKLIGLDASLIAKLREQENAANHPHTEPGPERNSHARSGS